MRTILKISEASAIALHAIDLMAKNPAAIHSATQVADKLGVSYNHLAKVLQRLTKDGFVKPVRGPKGGFIITTSAKRVTVGELLEAIEGPLKFSNCLMQHKVCERNHCKLGVMLKDINHKFDELMSTKLSDF